MSIISIVLVILVASLFFYIMYLETIVTDSDTTARVFNMELSELKRPSLNVLFKNQGIYNGLLGVLLLYATFFVTYPKEFVAPILVYMIVVAAYGAITSDKMIIVKQGGLPILALLSLLF